MRRNNLIFIVSFFSLLISSFVGIFILPKFIQSPAKAASGPTISNISNNLSSYPNSQVPAYEKFEVTFQVATLATNLQIPYDSSPPPGVEPGTGITVNALFTPDNWQTIYTQPAFYYQEFDDRVKSGKEWFYPTGNFSWKVRFAPNKEGIWQYKLSAQDASGTTETQTQSFMVTSSNNKGFIKASQKDARYFEFDDGTYFPGLGYNMNYNHVHWVNPILDNQENFQKMSNNGIQLIRIWLSQWSIFSSAWNPWYGIRNDYDGYIPRPGLIISPQDSPAVTMVLVYSEDSGTGQKNSGSWFDACRFIGGFQAPPAVKQNTKYHIKIRYRAHDITGPRNATYPNYGFVAKVQNPNDGNWHTNCYEPGDPTNGKRVSFTYGHDSDSWVYLEGEWNSGSYNFLPIFYLALENINPINSTTGNKPYVYIDTVFIGEDFGGGQYGSNIVTKPSMEHHLYFMERNAYAFDKVVDLAHQDNIYLRPVILEKNEVIQNEIGYDGKKATFSNNNFYGDYRNITAIRWLQQAWWRYLQARWGYSSNIHSWELLNEGDPWNSRHYTLTDELGKYMHQFRPNDHLVSTSNWHSFPKDGFWANPDYPNVDFADYHQYVPSSDPNFYDTAKATYDISMWLGANQSGGAGKPVIRGETGFTDSGTQPGTDQMLADTEGTWLHNLIWGGINPGGLIESYWYENTHIYTSNFDHRNQYGNYYNFIKNIHLNNGYYEDAQAVVSDPNLRAWGQKDLVNGRVHLWIQNKNHTWKNVVDGVNITPITGTVTIPGFKPDHQYQLEWWDTYSGTPTKTQSETTNANGDLILTISDLATDLAVKVADATAPSPTPTPALPIHCQPLGDIDCSGKVNALDLSALLSVFGTNDSQADLDDSGKVNALDLSILLGNFGKIQ